MTATAPQQAVSSGAQDSWMEEVLTRQLSTERDFQHAVPVKFQYAILCGHRMGSNMLSEALYETGLAGDPMEFFNLRLLKRLFEQRGTTHIAFADYIAEMKSRRTSPNGVFGFNIKADQFINCFKDNQATGIHLIKDCQYVLLLTRKDKIRQAVSQYIGQQRDTFRIPADADYEEVKEKVATVPFNPAAIAHFLHDLIKQEQMWVRFLHMHEIAHDHMTYEELAGNYEKSIKHVLKKIGVPTNKRKAPPIGTMKISTPRNDEMVEQFRALLAGDSSMSDLLPESLLQRSHKDGAQAA